jgi:hypothetical protein
VRVSDDDQFGPQTPAVRRFLAAIQQLTIDQWREVIEAWRTTVTDIWHDADTAVSAAVSRSDRRQARENALSEVGDITRRMRWESGSPGGPSGQAIASSAEYIASLTTMALLMRDRITRQQFDALYFPFMGPVPLETIEGIT